MSRFDEFKKKVTEELAKYLDSEEDAKAFVETPKIKGVIEDEYKYSERKLDSGIITEEQFFGGAVDGVAYCLYMMF